MLGKRSPFLFGRVASLTGAATSTFTGITLTMPDAEIQLIQLDGGQKIQATEATDTAGILYPGERMDLVVSWSQVGQQNPAALIISLDEEYVFVMCIS
jgi:hypothetical protein